MPYSRSGAKEGKTVARDCYRDLRPQESVVTPPYSRAWDPSWKWAYYPAPAGAPELESLRCIQLPDTSPGKRSLLHTINLPRPKWVSRH